MFDLLSVESPYDYALAWFSEQYTSMIVGREHEIFLRRVIYCYVCCILCQYSVVLGNLRAIKQASITPADVRVTQTT